jgi:hypothetical protein
MESETVITRTPWNQDVNTEMSTSGSLTIRVTVRRQSQQQNIIFVAPLIGMYNIAIHTSPTSGFLTILPDPMQAVIIQHRHKLKQIFFFTP